MTRHVKSNLCYIYRTVTTSVQRFKLHNTTGTMYLHILQSVLPTQHTPKSKLDKHTIYRHTKHLSVTDSQRKYIYWIKLQLQKVGHKRYWNTGMSLNLQFIHNHEQKVS